MTRDELISIQEKLGMTIPLLARFLQVSEQTVHSWRRLTKNQTKVPGPAIVALRLECEKRGIPWKL